MIIFQLCYVLLESFYYRVEKSSEMVLFGIEKNTGVGERLYFMLSERVLD